jgi:hypothetical protein
MRRTSNRRQRRLLGGAALGVAMATTAFAGVAAPAALALEPPAPGNLIANWGFDTGTSGWGSFSGTLARTTNGSTCSTTNPGAATVTRQTGSVYTISDSQGGNLPTVPATSAGQTFVAYATVLAPSASAAGKPARIILRERAGATGTIYKETATSFSMPPAGGSRVVAVSTVAVRSGTTMGLRIEQSSAGPGDAFSVDDIVLRVATRAFGPANPGTIWTKMSTDLARTSAFNVVDANGYPDTITRYLDRLRVYVDGKGGATGSQKLRAIIYTGVLGPAEIVRASQEVTVAAGMTARWVDFRFDDPVRLSGFDGSTYQFGLLSGPARDVARYAATSQPYALTWGPDRYADGPNRYFGSTDPLGSFPTKIIDDKQMSIQGIAAPVGRAHAQSCF